MDDMDCDAHLYARVTNTTDEQWNDIGNYDMYIPGPCMLPIQLEVPGDEQVNTGGTELSLIVDYLDEGNYTLEYYLDEQRILRMVQPRHRVQRCRASRLLHRRNKWDCSVPSTKHIQHHRWELQQVYSESYLDNPSCYQSWMDLT